MPKKSVGYQLPKISPVELAYLKVPSLPYLSLEKELEKSPEIKTINSKSSVFDAYMGGKYDLLIQDVIANGSKYDEPTKELVLSMVNPRNRKPFEELDSTKKQLLTSAVYTYMEAPRVVTNKKPIKQVPTTVQKQKSVDPIPTTEIKPFWWV